MSVEWRLVEGHINLEQVEISTVAKGITTAAIRLALAWLLFNIELGPFSHAETYL
jgi:hypothetical protein